MDLRMALDFIRSTDVVNWDLMIDEMNRTRRQRDIEAAKNFEPGVPVVFEIPDRGHRLDGRVIHITRGRLILAVAAAEGGLPQRISVPASYVRHVA